MARAASAVALWPAVVAAAAAAGGRSAHIDGPPLAHTGGFGEPTCRKCHFDRPLNDSAGSLELTGLPTRLTAGERRVLEVVLRRPDLARGGFQLTARFAAGPRAGEQAGAFEALDGTAVARRPAGGATIYVQHSRSGTLAESPGTARWRVAWRAPAATTPVAFHLAANAANDDDSEFGDHIYVHHVVVSAED